MLLRPLVRAGLVTALLLAASVAPVRGTATGEEGQSLRPLVEWDTPGVTQPAAEVLAGRVQLVGDASEQVRVRVRLENATFVAIPQVCLISLIPLARSWITPSGRLLVCAVADVSLTRGFDFRVLVDDAVGATVTAAARVGGVSGSSAGRRIVAGREAPARLLRLVSSPDFLNADVGDLRKGPSTWRPGRPGATENSINRLYRDSLDSVLDDWADLDPDAVLVAGDLVDGWWGRDDTGSGNFGPVATLDQRRRALARAAATYYPQWLQRFRTRDLTVLPAMGDHEYGDNPWPRGKLGLVDEFEAAFARHLMRKPDGSPRFADRPAGSPHASTAYAFRPHPEVQVVTLNVFDRKTRRMRIRLDRAQLQWLGDVLARAERDGVEWVVVQGHTPILGPVRQQATTGLMVENGSDSGLWRTLRRYGVDLYLCGEVHDVTMTEQDGVVQLAHGGLFQYGAVNAAVLDVHPDRLEIRLRDYRTAWADAPDGSRLWETKPSGMPKILRVGDPLVIGTATLEGGGVVRDVSGILNPWYGPVS